MLHVPDITAHGWTLDTKGAVSVVWTLQRVYTFAATAY